ncbi:MAG: hypothetical protein HY273_15245 [Gammaproteobacteria bacterium]|nr:hypothetical protein [Gammaproteobacteria bacterium]
MNMSFEGFLESYDTHGQDIELRFAVGGFDPFPSEEPILFVSVHNAENIVGLMKTLESVRALDDYSYVEAISPTRVRISGDHEAPLDVRGESVSLRKEQYGPKDFQRLARINHEWGQSQYKSLRKSLAKISEVERLVYNQAQRVHAKMPGHREGTTARTLYEQHLSFLERVISELKA